MASCRDTILSAVFGAALVLTAGSVLTGGRAPATAPAPLPAPTEARIATVDSLTILQALWEQPSYDTARKTLADQLQARLTAKQEEVRRSEANLQQIAESSRTRWLALPEGDPERTAIEAAYSTASQFHEQLSQSYEQMRADAQTQFDTQRSNQVRECFERVKQAVSQIAFDGGYTHVISHATSDEMMATYGFEALLQGIRDRPVIFAPMGTDLTEAVLARLGVARPTFGQTPAGGDATQPAAPGPGR